MGPKSKFLEKRAKNDEINSLNRLKTNLKSQVDELKRTGIILEATIGTKSEHLGALEAAIAREREQYPWDISEIANKTLVDEQMGERKMKELALKEKGIMMRTANYEFALFENERLHHELKELAFEQFKLTKKHMEEYEHYKQKTFDTRMLLDSVLRDTIKMVTSSYHQQAIAKMDIEATNALRDNVKLHTAFSDREERVEELIKQQKQSYEQLMKLRLEKEVIAATSLMHDKSVAKMGKEQEKYQQQIQAMVQSIQQLKQDIETLSVAAQLKLETQQERAVVHDELQAVKLYRKACYTSAIKLAKGIMSDSLNYVGDEQSYYGSCMGESFLNRVKGLAAVSTPALQPSTDNAAQEAALGLEDEQDSFLSRYSMEEYGFPEDKSQDRYSSQSLPPASMPATARLPDLAGQPGIDYNAMWNSGMSDCHLMNSSLRKLLRRQKKG